MARHAAGEHMRACGTAALADDDMHLCNTTVTAATTGAHIRTRHTATIAAIFAILAFVFGSIFILCTPAGAGLDEENHIERTYQVSRGVFFPQELDNDTESVFNLNPSYKSYGGVVDSALIEIASPNRVNYQATSDKYRFPIWTSENVSSSSELGRAYSVASFPNTAINTPFVYAAQAVSFLFASVFTNSAYVAILAMRFGALLLYIAGVVIAIRHIPFGKLTLAMLSLMPNALGTNCMVTADTFLYVACVGLFSFILEALFAERPSKANLIGLLIFSFMMDISKTSYMPLVYLVWLLPVLAQSERKRYTLEALGICVFSTAVALFWYLRIKDINSTTIFVDYSFPEQQMNFILASPLAFLKTATWKLFGMDWFDFSGLALLSLHSSHEFNGILTLLALMISFAFDYKGARVSFALRADCRKSQIFIALLGCILVFTATALLIVLGVYTQFNVVGSTTVEGLQVRYMYPLLVGIFALFLLFSLLMAKTDMKDGVKLDGKKALSSDTLSDNFDNCGGLIAIEGTQRPLYTKGEIRMAAVAWTLMLLAIFPILFSMFV